MWAFLRHYVQLRGALQLSPRAAHLPTMTADERGARHAARRSSPTASPPMDLSYLRSTQDVIINHASAIFSTRYTFLNAHVLSSPLINK